MHTRKSSLGRWMVVLAVSCVAIVTLVSSSVSPVSALTRSHAPSAGEGAASTPGEGVVAGSVEAASLPEPATPASVPGGAVQSPPDGSESKQVPSPDQIPHTGGTPDISGLNAAPESPTALTYSWEGPRLFTDSSLIPPDPIVAAGPKDVTILFNNSVWIYSRTGANVLKTTADSFFSGVSFPSGTLIFDPRIVYVMTSDRWIMVWAAQKASTSQSWFAVACSKTSDPRGAWWTYALDATLNGGTATTNWADYPMLGVNTSGISISTNMYKFSDGSFQYAKVRFLDKSAVCSGGSVSWWDQWGMVNGDASLVTTLQPAQQYDNTSTQYLVNTIAVSGTVLTFWRVTNVLNFSTGPTFNSLNVTVSAYAAPPDAVQPSGVQAFDNTGTAVLDLAERNGLLFGVFTTAYDWGSGSNSNFRYFRLSNLGGTPAVDIDLSWGLSGLYYFYPAITVDGANNAAIGFARSGGSEFGGARYTGQKASEGAPFGTVTCADGTATYLQLDSNSRNRWGDYTGIDVAPDLSTFYIFNEYVGASNTWYSRVCTARFKQRAITDYDRSGKTGLSVFRPSTGVWYLKGLSNSTWGASGDVPVPGDYNGDGRTDIAIWRPSTGIFYVKGQFNSAWGSSGDVPVPGDYDGDGTTDIAIWRPSTGTWYVKGQSTTVWGQTGDIPVPGDYNNDGKTELAVFRPSTGVWYIKGVGNYTWGSATDIPVPGDYDGNGKTDVAIFRPSTGTWYVRGGANYVWGTAAGDIPVPADYNGDGITDIAVWRPSTGQWWLKSIGTFSWGSNGDYPLVAPDTNGNGTPYQ